MDERKPDQGTRIVKSKYLKEKPMRKQRKHKKQTLTKRGQNSHKEGQNLPQGVTRAKKNKNQALP